MNIPNIVLNALSTANTPAVATADAGNPQLAATFSNILDAVGRAETSAPAEASLIPVAETSDGDDNSGVIDSVAASIILLFSGFEFPANTLPAQMEQVPNEMPVGQDVPVADSLTAATGLISSFPIQAAVTAPMDIAAPVYPETVGNMEIPPNENAVAPVADANAMNMPADASGEAFASQIAQTSNGESTAINLIFPAKPDAPMKQAASAMQTGAGNNPAVADADDIGKANQQTGMKSQLANLAPEPAPKPAPELAPIMTASNVFVIESSAKTGIPVAHVMPDGVSSERGRASTQNVARQKHGEIKYEGEAPEMRTEAIFADTESEALIHADMAKGNSMEGIINRVGLPEKHESAQSAISPGNVSAISAYETVRTMDHAFGIAESAKLAESAESPDVRANVVAQLQEPVTRAINRGADNIRMRLQPEGLGELRVNIRMVDGGVRLEIITDKILSRQILEQGLPELQSLMREDGISLKNVRVEYGGADGGGDRETPRRRDEHPPYRHNNGNGKRRENFAGYFA